jgi:hypothetical protein
MSRINGGAVWSNRPRTELARGVPGRLGTPTLPDANALLNSALYRKGISFIEADANALLNSALYRKGISFIEGSDQSMLVRW